MIKIICLGKIKEKYLKDAINDYQKRLEKYTKLEIIELPDEPQEEIALRIEEQKIRKAIKNTDNLVILDKDGQEYNSVSFSKFVEKELCTNSNITFLIGSSQGFSENLRKEINKTISFSKLTFPYQVFRLLLLEQIYRSFKLINNESYHK